MREPQNETYNIYKQQCAQYIYGKHYGSLTYWSFLISNSGGHDMKNKIEEKLIFHSQKEFYIHKIGILSSSHIALFM